MARFAIIRGGAVANIVEAEPDFAAEQGWIDATGAAIGDLWDGEAFQPAPPPAPVVPASVTMRQARLALLAAGRLADVAPAIAALPSPQKEEAQIEWEYSQAVERNRPFVQQIGVALGLSEAALDQLFITAATL